MGGTASPRDFLRRALGSWSGPELRTAWFWSIAALLVLFANLAVNVGYNRWNKWFFDALERKDTDTLVSATFVGLVLVVVGAGYAVLMTRCRMTLQVKWRQWLTRILQRWLSEQGYYRLAITDEQQMNPEYRIAEDMRLASEPVVDFTIGFINALLSAVTFVGILLEGQCNSRCLASGFGSRGTSRSQVLSTRHWSPILHTQSVVPW
jgi:vitamin B12/bleomycin/antimicrobial peptide transport system ATP-binding/permease protein